MSRARGCYLLAIAISLVSIAILSACSSGESAFGPDFDPRTAITTEATADITIVETGSPRLAQVQPVPGHIILSPGETIGVHAVAFDQMGQELRGASTNWQVVNSQAGTVTPSGVFRAGFNTGTFEEALVVTARAPAGMAPGLVQSTVSVTVAEFKTGLQPAGIRVFPNVPEMELKETLPLLALAVDANGVAIPNMKFEWEVLEPQAGTVSKDGRLTAGESIGTFSRALRVSLVPRDDDAEQISRLMDIRVMDPTTLETRLSATVLPQVISLRPDERIRFSTMVLDRRGNPLAPIQTRWEVLDPRAGAVSQDGRFTAGQEPNIYRDAVRASMTLPGVEEPVVTTGTIIIVDVQPTENVAESVRLARVAIFPDRVVLSPGESARVSIVGVNGQAQGLPNADIRWSVSPPEVGDVSQFVTVTAHDFPGIYEDAIRAEVLMETDEGPLIQEVSATLIIRGSLTRAEIAPGSASLAPGERVSFRAVAYDENDVLLSDIFFRWSVSDPAAGSIDSNGVFTAKGAVGTYPGAVEVQAVQRRASQP